MESRLTVGADQTRVFSVAFDLWVLPEGRRVLIATRSTPDSDSRVASWEVSAGHPLTGVIADVQAFIGKALVEYFTGHGGV